MGYNANDEKVSDQERAGVLYLAKGVSQQKLLGGNNIWVET